MASAAATAASRRDNPKRCLSSCLPVYICNNYDNVSAPKWFTCLWSCWLEAKVFGCRAHCVYATCACVPSETFCRPTKFLLAIIKTNKLCAFCTLRELRGNWLSGCVSSLIGQRQRSSPFVVVVGSKIYANNIKLLNSFLCLTKCLAYFVLNLFACLKQLAAAHPPHTDTHTASHTHMV